MKAARCLAIAALLLVAPRALAAARPLSSPAAAPQEVPEVPADHAAPTEPAVSPRRPVVVLLGDSLTEFASRPGGFHLLLTHEYTRKADVINRGYAGYNTRWAKYVLPEITEQFAPGRVALATVFFGANDANDPTKDKGFLSVPIEEYSANLKAIAAALRAQGIKRLVFIGPPPVDESKPKWVNGTRTNKAVGRYTAAAAAVAKEEGAPFVNLFNGFQANKDWRSDLMDVDGGHLGPKGHVYLSQALLSAVRSAYPCAAPEALPLHFPDFMKIDSKEPSAGFKQLYGASGAGEVLDGMLEAC